MNTFSRYLNPADQHTLEMAALLEGESAVVLPPNQARDMSQFTKQVSDRFRGFVALDCKGLAFNMLDADVCCSSPKFDNLPPKRLE